MNRIVAEEDQKKRSTNFRLVCTNLREDFDDDDSVNSDQDDDDAPSHYLWCLEEAEVTVFAKSSDSERPV